MAGRKEWMVTVDGQARQKGSKTVMIAAFESFSREAAAYKLKPGTVVELVEVCDCESTTLRKVAAQSRGQAVVSSVRYVAEAIQDLLDAKSELEKKLAERAAKDGFADMIRWCARDALEAEGKHEVFHAARARWAAGLDAILALPQDDQYDAAAVKLGADLAATLNEVARGREENLLRCANWVPSCTCAFDNAGRAFNCAGQAEAIRHLRDLAALIVDRVA